jgi:hypothetical protein
VSLSSFPKDRGGELKKISNVCAHKAVAAGAGALEQRKAVGLSLPQSRTLHSTSLDRKSRSGSRPGRHSAIPLGTGSSTISKAGGNGVASATAHGLPKADLYARR